MKTYMKPTLEVTELRPEESLAACTTRTRYFAWSGSCRKYKISYSTLST